MIMGFIGFFVKLIFMCVLALVGATWLGRFALSDHPARVLLFDASAPPPTPHRDRSPINQIIVGG